MSTNAPRKQGVENLGLPNGPLPGRSETELTTASRAPTRDDPDDPQPTRRRVYCPDAPA
jgi:hypothetical protein